MKKKLLLHLLIFACIASFAQPNVEIKDTLNKKASEKKDRNMFGYHVPRGLTVTTEGLAEGYLIHAVPNSSLVNLVNRKGEVVHQWKGNYSILNAYLQNDGSLIQGAEDPDFPVFGCCGPYGRLQKIDWNGKMLWDFEYANEDHIVHHDFAVMPNGHILAIANEAMQYDKAIAMGRKPEKTPKSGPWSEKIIEIEPQGKTGGKVVWEWHLWDHLIQDFDAKKANYGKLADHPELLNFNLGHPLPPPVTQEVLDDLKAKGIEHRNTTLDNRGSDIYHLNAIKYNPELDQIVFSSQGISEIFIIDHSTTTQQAASHKGGRYGKGGDILFRWGNPQNYKRGDSTDRKLFGQHDVRWIEKGCPGAGDLTVFNNYPPNEIDWSNMGNTGNNYSAVYEIAPPVDKNGKYLLEKDKPFGPEKPVWKYMASDTLSFFSSFISGAQRMENGNTFINQGAKARFFEVTKDGKIVWEYLNPYHGDIRKPNGDPIPPMPMPYSTFRGNFIPANHPALANRKLEPLSPQPVAFVLPPAP
ncbi:MAG TPA: aryl-sulfate sulfotransferase [Segetibacter sp.]|nr:aryl-sulfate sulfotransferase [Segetibacter sp.]